MRCEEAGHRRIPPIQSLANTVDIAREILYVVATEPSLGIDSTGDLVCGGYRHPSSGLDEPGFVSRQSDRMRDSARYTEI